MEGNVYEDPAALWFNCVAAAKCDAVVEDSAGEGVEVRSVLEKGHSEGICLDHRHKLSDPSEHGGCVGLTLRQALSSQVSDLDKGQAKYYIEVDAAETSTAKVAKLIFTRDIVFLDDVRLNGYLKRTKTNNNLSFCVD